LTDPPEDEVELSVFGRGVGEALAVNLGQGAWVLVDSFTVGPQREPIALTYLAERGVDPSQVVLVVATHWDDDHIQGITKVLRAASNARFVLSAALNDKQFFEFASLHQQRTGGGPHSSGLREFIMALAHLKDAGRDGPVWAVQDKLLWSNGDRAVTAIAPSDATMSAGFAAAAPRPADAPRGAALRQVTPNGSSVVLWVASDTHRWLLGADLECHPDVARGWDAAVGALARGGERAFAVKVPHHGSPDADHDDMWQQMLDPNPIAAVTRYARGPTPRPSAADRARLRTRTSRGYVVGRPRPRRHYEPIVRRRIESSTVSGLRPLTGGVGHLRVVINRDSCTVHDNEWVEAL
jgi:beta-lactamase superfamily II metal-dependent hydrolase